MSNTRSKGELGFQRHIIDALCADPRWHERKAATDYDCEHAVDRGMLSEFLTVTQPDTYDALVRGYGDRALDAVVFEYERACRANGSSQVDVLRSGVPNAIRIAKEFDLRITIEHCTEGHLIVNELKEAGVPV